MSNPIPIVTYWNDIFEYLTDDVRFKPGDAGAYINLALKGRYTEAPLYPVLNVYFANKVTEVHQTLGYDPWPTYIFIAEARVHVPADITPPQALLSALGLSALETQADAEMAAIHILTAMEDVLRFDNTAAGQQKRRLEDASRVAWMLPRQGSIDVEQHPSAYLYKASLAIEIFSRVNGGGI